ncbi:MAG: RagB/SusD family nutrient uptake outer membrane protein [Bacteroidales bacterium]
MKIKNIITLLALCGTLTSCNEYLDEVIYSELVTENAFVTQSDAEASVNGIYKMLNSSGYGLYCTQVLLMQETSTDVNCKINNKYETLSWTNLDQETENTWSDFYTMIKRANTAIDNIPKIADSEFTKKNEETKQDLKKRYLGEAYFLRGFAYYMLSDLFYKVPIITDSEEDVFKEKKLASIEDIELLIESDFRQAIDALPNRYPGNNEAGRVTQGGAYGMMCKLLMRRAARNKDAKEWANALTFCDKTLEAGYELLPDVWDVFNPANKYNNEIIFDVKANENSVSGSSAIGMMFTPWSYDCGWDNMAIPLEFAWTFDPEDQRLKKLILTQYGNVYNSPEPESETNFKQYFFAPMSLSQVGTLTEETSSHRNNEMREVCTQKYKYTKPLSYNYYTGNNFVILRQADVILCKAEILNELNGPTQEAVDLINMIRERAFGNNTHNLVLAAFNDKLSFRRAICNERAWELNNEGHRRSDLIRMGLWKEKLGLYINTLTKRWKKFEEAGNKGASDNAKVYPTDLTDDLMYYPIPKRETDLNPDLLNNRP